MNQGKRYEDMQKEGSAMILISLGKRYHILSLYGGKLTSQQSRT